MTNEVHGIKTNVPHVEWLDLHNDGVAHEIIILSRNGVTGDLYFISMTDLDQIDKVRIARVLQKKDAAKLPLWELLANETLKNGMNALEFFHQLAKIRTVNGKVFPVDSNKRGATFMNPEAQAAIAKAHAAKQKKAAKDAE